MRYSSVYNPWGGIGVSSDIFDQRRFASDCYFWSCPGAQAYIPQAGTWSLNLYVKAGGNNVPWNMNTAGTAIELFFVPE
jgi:hypothetical protein